ncbi:Intradiol ring-cleavage dioxygenase [Schizophyllum amplum]|uniref:Intradiol ring-cleavage dioxygenase n=1 Tax=Schizophyllum amplum TaxID=97359 RepID=A0A550C1S4_9AGAR|nr:Intradiol ring-cleavage dioxygenase [Auriculariopsis ampla]
MRFSALLATVALLGFVAAHPEPKVKLTGEQIAKREAICVTAPEVTEGPYYINDEYVRQDQTETQDGVKVLLDVGILDTETCEPVSNAQRHGVYGGYSGASNAINTETFLRGGVHLDWAQDENGQLQSDTGSLVHIGQFYFEEDLNDAAFDVAPYTDNTNRRTLNANDGILQGAIRQGDNPYLDVELLEEDISGGVLGYITLGVDSSAAYTIRNKNALGQ